MLTPHPTPSIDAPSFDDLLRECAREPIHVPGSIQPYGLLIVLDPETWTVHAASANAAAHLGLSDPHAPLVGQPLDALLGAAGSATVRALAVQRQGDDVVSAGVKANGETFEVALHVSDGLVVLEMLPEAAFPEDGPEGEGQETLHVYYAFERMQVAAHERALCARLAEEVHTLTGFDRVMVYRFDEDWNGEVVAERRRSGVPESFAGLHFPASDIPEQARALYVRNRTRLIADARYAPVPIGPATHPDGRPLDLSLSVLRSVSPVHLEYLANMGVRASMSISIVREGVLWGLIACHHRTPRAVAYRTRAACALLAQVFGMLLDRHQAAESEKARAARRTRLARLVDGMLRTDGVMDGLGRNVPDLLALTASAGAALVAGSEVTLVGETPPEADVRALAEWVGERYEDGVYATDTLERAYPPAESFRATGSGLLAIALTRRRGHAVLWFRPEQPKTVYWAGEPGKAVAASGDGAASLRPRTSFEAWKTVVGGRSHPWRPEEHETARDLRTTVLDLVYERVEETRRLNDLLRHTNQTLETRNRELLDFAHVASHDLREPVRKLRTFAALLLKEHAGLLPPEALDYLERMDRASGRLLQIIGDLLEFSRVVTHGRPLAYVDLGAAVASAVEDLDLIAHEAGATIEASGPWPTVEGDPAQLTQLVRLLIENALKFRHPSRAPHVRVRATRGAPGGVRLVVQDNGIGIETRHAERIFRPFERLHTKEAYAGTGMGLSIGRRIVERHGGTIEARGTPGEGATFEVWLPQLPPDPDREPDAAAATAGPTRPHWLR